jgi:hypothetical protein
LGVMGLDVTVRGRDTSPSNRPGGFLSCLPTLCVPLRKISWGVVVFMSVYHVFFVLNFL